MEGRQPGMDNIEIHYWKGKLNHLDWEDGQVFSYPTKSKFDRGLAKILARIKDAGYNAMLLNNNSIFTTIVFIDNGRFRQS